MQPRSRVALVAALVLAAGCYTVHATRAPNVNLAQYRTFAVSPRSEPSPSSAPVGAVIRDAVVRNLEAKGMVPAAYGQQPDFLVEYHLKKDKQMAVSGWGWPYGYWGVGYWGWGGPVDVYEYTTGTVIVDFIDPRTNVAFWRGTATTVIDAPENPEPKKMDKAVAKIFKKYPMELATAGGRTAM